MSKKDPIFLRQEYCSHCENESIIDINDCDTCLIDLKVNIISKEMKLAGEEIANYLMSITIENAMGENNTGGCRSFDINNYPKKYHRIIKLYLNEDIVSVEAIYLAMENERKSDNG